ncbi:MAG: molecular chaperone DnaJ [Clostridiales bacterium]|nr:molecular chaperone DnaJ [Clostridiales bacterium]
MKDYYEILGVPPDADAETIKKAYRRLARQYHPDARPGDPEAEARFKEINEAYQVLGDPQKRAQYDRMREAGASGFGGFQGFQGFEGFQGFDPFADLGDLFESFFGGGPRPRGPQRGADLELQVEVDLEDAYQGTSRSIRVRRLEICPTCHGSGAAPGTHPRTCHVCGGRGRVRVMRQALLGTMAVETVCPQCHGTGQEIDQPCPTCRGDGRVEQVRTLEVKIPPGVDDGMRLRLRGQGHAGSRPGYEGDLFVRVKVKSHPLFRREGPHLYLDLPLPYPTLVLGGTASVPTLEGDETLQVPPGTPDGHVFQLKGKGMPHIRTRARGDLYVTVRVAIPKKLSDEEKQLLLRLAELQGAKVQAPKGFFGRMKDVLGGGGR